MFDRSTIPRLSRDILGFSAFLELMLSQNLLTNGLPGNRLKNLKLCILCPKLFRPTVRKKCSSDRAKIYKFEVEGREFAKILRSQEKFIQTMKSQYNF